ncbi:hypothetical protein YC2023_106713 [Brassica napus]
MEKEVEKTLDVYTSRVSNSDESKLKRHTNNVQAPFSLPLRVTKKMEVPIWQWCLIVIAIILLAIASHYLGRVLCSPRERTADSKIEKKHGPAAQEKTEKKGGEQLV